MVKRWSCGKVPKPISLVSTSMSLIGLGSSWVQVSTILLAIGNILQVSEQAKYDLGVQANNWINLEPDNFRIG